MQGRGDISCHAIFLVLTHEIHETHELSFGPYLRKCLFNGYVKAYWIFCIRNKRQSR